MGQSTMCTRASKAAQQHKSNSQPEAVSCRAYPGPSMDDDGIICCLSLICIVSFATGFPSVYYGQKCKNAALRAQRKDLCKNFSNDASALALQIFGWILSIPWLVALFYCVSKCCPGGVAVDVQVWDATFSPTSLFIDEAFKTMACSMENCATL